MKNKSADRSGFRKREKQDMTVKEILDNSNTAVSFEFFPPKTEAGWDNLFHTISDLMPLKPSYVSVTYGAGGSTRAKTHELVVRVHRETDIPVVAHLTCVGSTEKDIGAILEKYEANGIRNILALRGDTPKDDPDAETGASDFPYCADLVRFIKKNFPDMGVGVAGFAEGHPETPNRIKELEYLKAKVDEGADYIVTQLFFTNRDYYDFVERCQLMGIEIPIIAGIMPITSKKSMYRMADLAGGSRIPAALHGAVERAQGKERVKNVGIHWATEQARDLIHNNVPGIHLYTLNNSLASMNICESLGLRNYMALSA